MKAKRNNSSAAHDREMTSFAGGPMQRMVDRFFGGFLTPLWKDSMAMMPALDMKEVGDKVCLTLDLPGVEKADITIEMQGDQLCISGERTEEKKEDSEGQEFQERFYGSFQRSITVPRGLDIKDIKANFHNGVLEVTFPKTEKEAQKIQISEDKPQGKGAHKKAEDKKEEEKARERENQKHLSQEGRHDPHHEQHGKNKKYDTKAA